MEKTVTVEIPEQWLRGLEWGQAEVLREILQLGVY
jgi:hypothetical protein